MEQMKLRIEEELAKHHKLTDLLVNDQNPILRSMRESGFDSLKKAMQSAILHNEHQLESYKAIHEATKHAREAFGRLSAITEVQSQIGAHFAEHRAMYSAMSQAQKVINQHSAALKTAMALHPFHFDIERTRILSVLQNGIRVSKSHEDSSEVSIAPNNSPLESVSSAVDSKLNQIESHSTDSIQSILISIWKAIYPLLSSAKGKFAREVAFGIILNVFCNSISHYLDPHLPELGHRKKIKVSNQVISVVRKIPQSMAQDIEYTNLRFVKVVAINVRFKPNGKSSSIGKLEFGTVLKICATKKDWALVELVSIENECSVKGWVKKKYLMKFR